MASEQDRNRELAERYYNATLAELLELTDEVIAEDFVMHDPTMPAEIRGREGLNEYYRTFDSAFSDARIEANHILAVDEYVVVRYTIRGTHDKGELFGVEPTGNEFRSTGIDINRMKDGQFAETWSEYDALGLMQQLGIVSEQPLD